MWSRSADELCSMRERAVQRRQHHTRDRRDVERELRGSLVVSHCTPVRGLVLAYGT